MQKYGDLDTTAIERLLPYNNIIILILIFQYVRTLVLASRNINFIYSTHTFFYLVSGELNNDKIK